jgi:hypothetical protein
VSRDPETSDPLISKFSLIEIYGGCAPMRLRWSVEIAMQHGMQARGGGRAGHRYIITEPGTAIAVSHPLGFIEEGLDHRRSRD